MQGLSISMPTTGRQNLNRQILILYCNLGSEVRDSDHLEDELTTHRRNWRDTGGITELTKNQGV